MWNTKNVVEATYNAHYDNKCLRDVTPCWCRAYWVVPIWNFVCVECRHADHDRRCCHHFRCCHRNRHYHCHQSRALRGCDWIVCRYCHRVVAALNSDLMVVRYWVIVCHYHRVVHQSCLFWFLWGREKVRRKRCE